MKSVIYTIIVPVFNGERFVDRCVQSILGQTYKSFELIIIDDGSTDSTNELLKKYENNEQITIITKKNEGVSIARNKGLELSAGKYIVFIDIDDWVDYNFLEEMDSIQKEDDGDLIITNLYRSTEETDEIMYNMESFKTNSLKELYDSLVSYNYEEKVYNMKYSNVRCLLGKVYKADIIKNNGIGFVEKLRTFEDGLFNLEYLKNCKTISVIRDAYYHYYQNINSVTHSYLKQLFDEDKFVYNYIKEFCEANDIDTTTNYACLEFYNTLVNMECYNNANTQKKVTNIREYYNYFEKEICTVNSNCLSIKHKLLLILSKMHLFHLVYVLYRLKNNIKMQPTASLANV